MEEELLSVWLHLTSVIDNQRLVSARPASGHPALPFNEAVICGLLFRGQEAGEYLTASALCKQTRILKSQMNAILHSLEDKRAISRRQSETDRRQVEIRLLPEGAALYQESHKYVRRLVSRLIQEMGAEKIEALLPLLRQAAEIFDEIQQEA